MKVLSNTLFSIALFFCFVSCDDLNSKEKSFSWGTEYDDIGNSIKVDVNGNIYVAGITDGNLEGDGKVKTDAFVTKLNSDFEILWTTHWKKASFESVGAMALDSEGNIYVTGCTDGEFGGSINAGKNDAYLVKLNNNGEILWTRQWGTSGEDHGFSVATDNLGNAVVTGYAYGDLSGIVKGAYNHIFLVKFNADGEQLWLKQLGNSIQYDENEYELKVMRESGRSVAVDSEGNIFITGNSKTDLDNYEKGDPQGFFIAKFDTNGEELWFKFYGNSYYATGYSIILDPSGNIFACGYIDEESIIKFDSSGKELWTKHAHCSINSDYYSSNYYNSTMFADNSGNVFVAGNKSSDITEEYYSFVTKFLSNGVEEFTKESDVPGDEYIFSATSDINGNAFLTGKTPKRIAEDSYNYEIFLIEIPLK